ncbi:hypothetical protein C8R46DRAFT_1346255 [Mycena filopes]|nr:hypothetical protein C8R46DRAFT_1346255 [Mycena filopes]
MPYKALLGDVASGTTCAYKAINGTDVNTCVYSNFTTDADTCTLSLQSGNVACPSHIGDASPSECPFTNKDTLPLIGFEPVLGSQLCTYLAGVEADSFQPCNYLQATGKLIGGPDACPDALGDPRPVSGCPTALVTTRPTIAPPCPGHATQLDGTEAELVSDKPGVPSGGFVTCIYRDGSRDGSACIYSSKPGPQLQYVTGPSICPTNFT